MLAVGALFWAMGLFTLGAYAYAIHRPLKVYPLPVYLTSVEAPRSESVSDVPVSHVLELPAVVIYGRAPAKVAWKPVVQEAAPAVPAARDLSEMRCADWRPLQQGGSSVRECI